MHFKLIACKVLQREIASIAYRCPHTIDISMIKQMYHETPTVLNQVLQAEIDRIDENTDPHTNDLERRDVDAILLGYGLCSNALLGLRSKKYPIVIPKAHDCATLVMGSKEAYQEYFNTYKGSYFFTRGWYELGTFTLDDERVLEEKRQQYMEKYDDEEAVEYLLEIEREMLKNYSCITYVDWPEISDGESRQWAREMAQKRNWTFNHMLGSATLMEDLLYGRWDPEKFLVLEPGETAAASYDDQVIKKQ